MEPEDGTLSETVRHTLRIGILLSTGLLLLGMAIALSQGTAGVLAPPTQVSLATLPNDLAHGRGEAVVLLGLLTLVVTPIARVVVSFGHFVRSKDRSFSVITAFVLAILTLSVLIGLNP